MEEKAQGAIEYLLIIGAAVLIVAIVVGLMGISVTSGKNQGNQANTDVNKQLGGLGKLDRNVSIN